MGYAGDWLPMRLTCGRLRDAPSSELSERLQNNLRRSNKVKKSRSLTRLGGDYEMEFECHRPFWSDEWELDWVSNINLCLPSTWDEAAVADKLTLFESHAHLRRCLNCLWGFPPAFPRRGFLRISHTIVESHLKKDAENPAHWRRDVSYELATAPVYSAATCGLMRSIAQKWDLEPFIVGRSTSSGQGFDLEGIGKGNRFRANCTPSRGDEMPFPVEIDVINLETDSEALSYFRRALELLIPANGNPSLLKFFFVASAGGMPRYVDACRKIKPVWDNWSFFGKYRKGFDPFARPKSFPQGEVRVYPILQYANDHLDNLFQADKLFIRASVIHTHDESFIELQTSEGREWLEKAAEYAGCPVDVWEGPIEQRWGLYT